MAPHLRNAILVFLSAIAFVAAVTFAKRDRAPIRETTAPAAAVPSLAEARPTELPRPRVAVPIGATRTADVCGAGPVETKDSDTLALQIGPALDRSTALARGVAQLGASGDPADRAVALAHDARRAFQGSLQSATSGRGCRFTDDACMRAAHDSARLAAQGHEQALVQHASESGNPVAFALAFYKCSVLPARRPPGCEAITADRWAAIEPDNGVAWLFAAGAAEKARNETARVAALERAANAARFDLYAEVMLRPLASPAVAQAAPLDRLAAHLDAMQAMSAVAAFSPQYQARAYCAVPLAAERKPLCDRLATALVERDSTLVGRIIATQMGETVGWPAERVAALRTENEAMFMMSSRPPPDLHAAFTCASIAALERRQADTLRLGERAALSGEIERTGKSLAELSREYRALFGKPPVVARDAR